MKRLVLLFILCPALLFSQSMLPGFEGEENSLQSTESINDNVDVVSYLPIDFYMQLMNTIDSYGKYSSFRKSRHFKKYDNLFTSEARVFDDIVPSSTFGKSIRYNEYPANVRALKRKRLITDVDILEIGEQISDNDKDSGKIEVYARITRNMAFESKEGNISYGDKIEYIDWPQTNDCKITLNYTIYQEENGGVMQEGIDWKISSIENINEIKKLNIYIPFTKRLFAKAILYNDSNAISLDGNEVNLTGENINYFVSENLSKASNLIRIIGRESQYSVSFKPLKGSPFVNSVIFKLKNPLLVNYNFNLGNNASLTVVDNNNQDVGSFEYLNPMSLSATFYFYSNPNLFRNDFLGARVNVELGANILYSSSSLSISDGEFTSVNNNAVDVDGHSYVRTSYISDIQEDIEFESLHLFLGARAGVVKNNWQFTSFVNALLLPLQNKATSVINAKGQYTGEYSQFFGLIIGDDEQFERYDLGVYDLSNTKDLVVNHKFFSMFEIGLTGELMYPSGWGGNIGLSTILSSGKWMESITSDLSTGSNNINSILEVIDGFNVTNRLMLKIGITKRL